MSARYQVGWLACSRALAVEPKSLSAADYLAWVGREAAAFRSRLGIASTTPIPREAWRAHLAAGAAG